MKRKLALLITFVVVGAASNASADVLISINESGGDVVANLSGSMNLDALGGLLGQSSNVNFFGPAGGNIAFGGAGSTDFYGIDIGSWAPFGSGGFDLWDALSGDNIATYSDPVLGLPVGYTSGASLSGSATKFGTTLAALGMDPGTYVNTLTNGNFSDTVTIQVGNVIPEPTSLALLGLGALGIALRRRRS